MFSNKERLKKRTPKNAADREEYLKQLVEEFTQTTSLDSKLQVLANLANFAYDPLNYEYLRAAGALHLFIQLLSAAEHQDLRLFATAGICNLCLDPINAKYIVQQGGVQLLINLLSSDHESIVLNVITSLLYLLELDTEQRLQDPEVYKVMVALCESTNVRIKNLATIFVDDVYGKRRVNELNCEEMIQKEDKLQDIPLPV